MPTSDINRPLTWDRDRVMGLISDRICGVIQIYNARGVKDESAWDLFYDIICLDPVTTHHFHQFQLMWLHRRSRSSPFLQWWAAFHSCMAQMFDKTRNQMNHWRWDNPVTFGDQDDHSYPHTTSLGKVKLTGERFSWYGCDNPKAKIEQPSCWQYKPGEFLFIRPLNWDEIIDEDDDDENWADPGGPSSGRSHPGDGNANDDSEWEVYTQGGEEATGKGKGTMDGKGKGKGKATKEGKGKGNGKGQGIVRQTPGGDDIAYTDALQFPKETYKTDSDTES
jgi:hypothetical protein